MACGFEEFLPFVYLLTGAALFTFAGSAIFLTKDYLTKQKQSKPVKTLDAKV